MRFIPRRLTTTLAALALAGLTVFAQTPAVPQTPPQTPQASQTLQTPQTPAAAAMVQPVPCVSSLPGISDAPVMLSHIDDILNDAVNKTPVVTKQMTAGAVGTSGGGAVTKVAIDRDKLDEIRAEIAQLKAILKK